MSTSSSFVQTFAEARIEELVLARKALFTDLIQLYRNALRTAGFAQYPFKLSHEKPMEFSIFHSKGWFSFKTWRVEMKWGKGKKEFIQLNFEYLKLKISWNDGYTFYVWWFVWCRKRVRFHRNYNSSRLWIASLKCHVSRQTNSKGLRCLFYDSSFFFYLISQLLKGHAIMLAYFILN